MLYHASGNKIRRGCECKQCGHDSKSHEKTAWDRSWGPIASNYKNTGVEMTRDCYVQSGLRDMAISERGEQCQKCGSTERIRAHHLIPCAHGGKDDLSNIALLCHSCHMKVHKTMGEHGSPNKNQMGIIYFPTLPEYHGIKNPNRSVMSLGKNGLCITLPIEWTNENGVKKGDLIRLTEEPAGLLLSKVI